MKVYSTGIPLHTGKTRTWNKAGVYLAKMAELGPSVWSHEGIKILGTPVGNGEFIQRLCEERIAKEVLVASNPLGARSSKRLENSFPVCQPEVPPFLEDVTALRVSMVRETPRRWHDGTLLGDRDVCPFVRLRHDSFAFAFGSRCRETCSTVLQPTHEFEVQPGLFRKLILERLRLPLHVTDAQCECGSTLDRIGTSQSSVRTFWSFEDESVADGEDIGESMPRS